MSSLPLVVDKGWQKVMECCLSEELSREESNIYRHFSDSIKGAVSTTGIDSHAKLGEYIAKCHEVVQKDLLAWASHYTALQWLWYIRRLPADIFKGPLITTFGYDAQLAEVLSGVGGKQGLDIKRESEVLHFEVNRSIMRRVLRFCHGARFLSRLHAGYRRVGKGQPYYFIAGECLPEFDVDNQIEDAISLYDERVGKYAHYLHRVGTGVGSSVSADSLREKFDEAILVVGRVEDPKPAPSFWQTEDGKKQHILVLTRFVPMLVNLSGLKMLNERLTIGANQVWSQQTIAVMYVLRLAIDLLMVGTSSFSKVQEYGYMVTSYQSVSDLANKRHQSIVDFIKKIFPSAWLPNGFDEVIQLLMAVQGSAWPIKPGGILRSDKGFLCVDLWGASAFLDASLEYPRVSGAVANIRAFHFEDMVQERIAKTRWRPADELLALRGKPLRKSGQEITDIDALATSGSILMAISCKSIVYSSDYDRGEYNCVRNAVTHIVGSVSDWKNKTRFLNQFSKGDNYDLASFTRIVGVVCTPHVTYVPIGSATEMVMPGLRASCSVDELIEWLESNKP